MRWIVEERKMQIIDSQIHLWKGVKLTPPHRQMDSFTVEDALAGMTEAGVDGVVIHPPESLADKIDVNGIAVDAVRRYPEKFCILGNLDLQRPDGREKDLVMGDAICEWIGWDRSE